MPLRTVALFTSDPWDSAMPHLRVRAPAEQAGIRVLQGNEYGTIFWDRIPQADVLIFQRDFPRTDVYDQVLQRARAAGKPIVYEVDDQLLDLPAWHISYPAVGNIRDRLLRGPIDAAMVVVSTRALRQYYRHYHSNVQIFPNYLQESLWGLREPEARPVDRPLRIGYMGGASHRPDLERIAPALQRAFAARPGAFQFQFWGVRPPDALLALPGTEWQEMDVLSYPAFVQQFRTAHADIWIAPLQPVFFNRFKSHIKYLEYTALGGAGIYSRMEPYTTTVRDGETGLLAQSADEWEAALLRLVDTPGLRDQLAQGAYQDVHAHWRMETGAPAWAALYAQVLDIS